MNVSELIARLATFPQSADVRIGTAEGFIVDVWRVSPGGTVIGDPLAVIEALNSGDPDDDDDNMAPNEN
jgi:hypothetical protein